MKSDSYHNIVITLFLILIAANLLLLDLKVFSSPGVKLSDIATSAPTPSLAIISDNKCPASCVSLINNLGQSTPQATPTTSPPSIIYTQSQHEFYIPLGVGSTSKNDWDDITSTDTLIDTSNYGLIKEAYFIASLRNPTQNGQIDAQLYNVTDKHPVWNSQVSLNGPLSQTLTSRQITIDTGPKLYRVQIKSSLQATIYLDYAKIRLVTK